MYKGKTNLALPRKGTAAEYQRWSKRNVERCRTWIPRSLREFKYILSRRYPDKTKEINTFNKDKCTMIYYGEEVL